MSHSAVADTSAREQDMFNSVEFNLVPLVHQGARKIASSKLLFST